MTSASQLARLIAAYSPQRVVVPLPDHPYLLRGPDILIADESGLLAVFVRHVREVRRPRYLETRMILSKLAFPSHTRFAFVPRNNALDLSHESSAPKSLGWDFISEADDPEQISRELEDVASARDSMSDYTRRAAFRRARLALSDRSRAINAPDIDYEEVDPLPSFAEVQDHRLFADVRGGSSTSTYARLDQLVALTIPREFAVDNGVIYPKSQKPLPTHEVRVPRELSLARVFDHRKVARSLAFAGWAVDEGEATPQGLIDGQDFPVWDYGE